MSLLRPSLSRTLLLISIALEAPVAEALWTESGEVRISVRDQNGSIVPREAFQVLPTDTVRSIEIGDPGPLGEREEGTLYISDEGSPEEPRALSTPPGRVELRVGSLDLNSVHGTGLISSGTLENEGSSSMSMVLSSFNDVRIGRGSFLGCQTSVIGTLRVASGGSAQLAGCNLEVGLDAAAGSQVQMTGGALDNGAHNLAGFATLTGVTAEAFQTDVFDGTVEFENVTWTDSQDFDAETLAAPLVFTVRGSMVTAQTSDFFGSASAARPADVALVGATMWASSGLVRIGTDGPFDVVLGARLVAGDDLQISRSSTVVTVGGEGTGSRIDVAGDASLDFFSVLNVEDGGTVDVDGTLTIGAGTAVNLNGGLLRVSNLVNEGTLAENGGVLVVPEAGSAAAALAACAALAARSRRARAA